MSDTALPPPRRYWEIDAVRGLMLVLMTITHVPTRFTDPLGQPFGFVSAAEGFVLLSAFVSGLVYGRMGYTQGVAPMRRGFWKRAVRIYMSQAALLLFLFTVITALAIGLHIEEPQVKDLLKYYLAHPHEGFLYSLLLVYQPALLDILPLYILFMLLSPWVMAYALRHGWQVPMLLSALLWAGAQFGMTPWLHEHLMMGVLGIPIPFNETGSFDTFAWQFLWFFGLWMGASRNAPGAQPIMIPRRVVQIAVVVAVGCLAWRHLSPWGQAPFGDDAALNLLFDKWRLGPLRLLDLAAIGIVAFRFGPGWLSHLPRPRWLETMGSASLAVFCAHLVAVLIVVALFGHRARPLWADLALLGSVFVWLYAVAWAVARFEARDRAGKRVARALADAGRRA